MWNNLLGTGAFVMVCVAISAGEPTDIRPLQPEQLSWNAVTVAAVQMMGARGKDQDAIRQTVDTVIEHIERAANDGAQLVVFPETILGNVSVEHPEVQRILQAAGAYRIYVIIGCYEILDDEGRYANNALVIDRDGDIIGRFSKVHPAVGEPPAFWPPQPDDIEWLMEKGDGFPVFDLDFARIGILICYDGYFPETYRSLALNGAEILVWINDRLGSVEAYHVKSAIAHNYVHMITSNWAHGAGTTIAQWPVEIRETLTELEPGYIVQTLPLDLLRYVRKNPREFRQRRPDLYGAIGFDVPLWEQYAAMGDDPPVPGSAVWNEQPIRLMPIDVAAPVERQESMEDGTDLSRIGFRMTTPWMNGNLELRFPEVLQSSMGFHFLDHYIAAIEPIGSLETWPQWTQHAETGALSYEAHFEEGISVKGLAVPRRDEVELTLTVTNRTEAPISHVQPNCCLLMGGAPDFNPRHDLDRMFAVIDGGLSPLSVTTPTPDEMGRDPWLLLLTPEGAKSFQGPQDSGTWWRVDQIAEENLYAAISRDERFVLGYTWDRWDLTMMTNCGNPCFHTGPGPSPEIAPDQSYTWKGKIYLIEGDFEELLARYKADQAKWQKAAQE